MVTVLKLVISILMCMLVLHLTQSQELPTSKNWHTDGYVTAAKDQEPCNSCWAFVTVGIIEWFHKHVTNRLERFSEQFLIDCATGRPYLTRCRQEGGGNTVSGLLAIRDLGIPLEEEYPWIKGDQNCERPSRDKLYYRRARFTVNTPKKASSSKLKKLLLQTVIGATIYINRPNSVWDGYDGSTILKERCTAQKPNHAVLLIGFDVDPNGEEFYWIKNS
ncbi:Cathepsin L isoform X2 [Aphelenchoides besseyi]|nr:Cathepsin L isoform X2 [Aphelenchoides besseyi]